MKIYCRNEWHFNQFIWVSMRMKIWAPSTMHIWYGRDIMCGCLKERWNNGEEHE